MTTGQLPPEAASDSAVTPQARMSWMTSLGGLYGRLPLKAKVGIVILSIYILVAIVGPMLAPYDPNATSTQATRWPRTSTTCSAPARPAATCSRRCSPGPARRSYSVC